MKCGSMVFYRVKKVNGKYYLYKEWYDPESGKRRSISLGNCEIIERLVRGVGFEPTQAYASGASARPLCPSSGTPAPISLCIGACTTSL